MGFHKAYSEVQNAKKSIQNFSDCFFYTPYTSRPSVIRSVIKTLDFVFKKKSDDIVPLQCRSLMASINMTFSDQTSTLISFRAIISPYVTSSTQSGLYALSCYNQL